MKWNKKDIPRDDVRSLSQRYGISTLAASIFVRRGIAAPSQILYYLEDDPRYLHNPFLFKHMEDAVDRVLMAREEGEKVLVFGDADTDGISSTVLLFETLSSMGLDCSWRVPVGKEAYGLSRTAIDEFSATGGTLIITVDCGISNHAEVLHARDLGVDVIILDHHRLQVAEPPEAVAVIDPKIEDCGYPFRDLAGCGVAYKFISALRLATSDIYKQQTALLDIHAEGDILVLEAVRLVNLVETARLVERLTPGEVKLDKARFVRFLSGQQIFVWDAASVTKAARALMGRSADLYVQDLAPTIGAAIPQSAGKSLEHLRELSRLGRYSEQPITRIDVLRNLFVSWQLGMLPELGVPEAHRLQLVALGTIADLMPLKDENRILVKRGLASMHGEPRPGLSELLSALQLRERKLGAHEVAWLLTPSINASGRLGQADQGVKLFITSGVAERTSLAAGILELNKNRRELGERGWNAVLPLARESAGAAGEKISIVGTAEVERGITGLIASRIAVALKMPAIIASFTADGLVTGSIRSARGFRVPRLLESCADLFIDFGGHDAAAGFSMKSANWETFVAKARRFMEDVELAETEETVTIDAELPHEYVTPDLLPLVQRFEPSGEESPPLVFLATSVPMVDAQIVGRLEKNHLKLTLDFGKNKWPAMLWDGASRLEREFSFRQRDRVDLVFKVGVNRYNGLETPQIEIIDIRRENPSRNE